MNNGKEDQNIDVYDYCDKMMKDLSHLDKKLENRTSANYKDFKDVRYSATSQKNASNQILNNYINQAAAGVAGGIASAGALELLHQTDDGLNNTNVSQQSLNENNMTSKNKNKISLHK